MTTRRYIRTKGDTPFTYSHIQNAGTWSGYAPDETTALTGPAFIGRAGNRAFDRKVNKPKGMSNGQRARLFAEQQEAKARQDAMPVVRDKRIDNPVEHPPRVVMTERPKPHGPQEYYVYQRGGRAGMVKLRSYTGTK